MSKGGAYYDDNGDLYLVDQNGVATLSETENGWVETEDGNKYYLIDGEAVKNQVIEIVFSQKMSLQGGQYLLSMGCTGYEEGEFTVYHRLYDACNLQVISSNDTIGFVDLNVEVSKRIIE